MNIINQVITDEFAAYHGDACEVIKGIPDNSIHFSIYSPPFSNLYIYSDSAADMGNSANDEEFFEHYKFLIQDLHRVTMPGRLSAVHCKDLPLYHNRDGAAGLKDFPGMIIRAHEEAGWTYHSRVTIWKDPVIEMQRTKNHGLLHKNFQARSEVCRQGMADYLIVFRKWDGVEGTESPEPVKHNLKAPGSELIEETIEVDPDTAWDFGYEPGTTSAAKKHYKSNGKNNGHKYIGDNGPTVYDSDRDYSIQVWQRYASPVWMDINQTRVLNYQMAREDSDERHICPLQLDVIDRSIDLWTNPGDIVLSPFMGIGSEGHCAIKQGRRFVGIELKESYFDWSVKNLKRVVEESKVVDLFSWSKMAVDGAIS